MNNNDGILEQFLKEWPIERVKNMTLEEYTNTDKTSFCYWMESKTNDLGSIWGGSSFKFGIFKRADTSKVEKRDAYKSEGDYVWVGKYGETKTEAFDKIRSVIVDIINFSEKKEFGKIDKIDLGTAFKWKIAFMYSNLSLLPIYKEEMLISIVKNQGIKVEKNFYMLQQRLLEQKAADTDIFTYANQLLEKIKIELPFEKIKYWAGGYHWGGTENKLNEFFEKGIWQIGNSKEVEKRENYIKLMNQVSKGDYIILKSFGGRNVLTISGLGQIVDISKSNKGILDINWIIKKQIFKGNPPSGKGAGNWWGTFSQITQTSQIQQFFNDHLNEDQKNGSLPPEGKKQIHPLNQILFGPPGTGKTYNSINHALAIVEGKKLEVIENESNENREEILRRFQLYIDSGQVLFTTFHQSMSYEDFIEGIKPIEVDGQLQYDVRPGVFRILVDNALTNYKNSKLQTGKKLFEDVWVKFLSPLNEEETIAVKMKKSSYQIVNVNDRTIFFDKHSGDSKHTLSVNTIKSMYDAGENKIIKGGLQPYYESLLGELLVAGKESGKVEQKNYVIIIDEINRGNVAQIFGELITLIETDKRFGNKEALSVTLPYSKKKDFSIPPNLHIIGTMNTADRSVEALDTALRRRFAFIEMPPRYDFEALKTEVCGITLLTIMEILNARVEKLLDKDHLIGHSYFLCVNNIADLKKVFQQSIISLLQEYFYGDFAKIGLVLGEAFFEKIEVSKKTIFAKFSHDAADELNEKLIYRLKQTWAEGEFEQAIQEMVNP